MSRPSSVASPRINRLLQALQLGKQEELEAFWCEVAQRGTPLVEDIAGSEQYVLVTFLWRASDETENVVVIGQLGSGQDFAENCMCRLLNTDLWHKTYQLRSDLRAAYSLSPNDSLIPYHAVEDWLERTATWQPDPLNPNSIDVPEQPKPLSTFELPNAPPQPWRFARADVPAGHIEESRFYSKILNNERTVWTYTPPGYGTNQEPYSLLVLFDGAAYLHVMDAPTTLDNLFADRQIPPLVAVLIDNVDFATRAVELTCHPPFAAFVTQELIPWVQQHYHVETDPSRAIVAGFSFGGLAATFIGLTHSAVFGNILSQSGSFWWKPQESQEHEWLTRQFTLEERHPLRIYLDVGLLETEATHGNGPSMVVVNRHMRNVLESKGYPVDYNEYAGGHDYQYWRGSLADGLIALMG